MVAFLSEKLSMANSENAEGNGKKRTRRKATGLTAFCSTQKYSKIMLVFNLLLQLRRKQRSERTSSVSLISSYCFGNCIFVSFLPSGRFWHSHLNISREFSALVFPFPFVLSPIVQQHQIQLFCRLWSSISISLLCGASHRHATTEDQG